MISGMRWKANALVVVMDSGGFLENLKNHMMANTGTDCMAAISSDVKVTMLRRR